MTFSLQDAGRLTVEGSGWTQLQPDQVSIVTKDGAVGAGLLFAKTSCADVLQRALAMRNTTSVAWPGWAPPWGSKAAKTIVRDDLTIVNVCRPYANGALSVVVSFYDKSSTSPLAQSIVGKLLVAIDQAASGKAAPAVPVPDAITEASEEEGGPLTLQGPNGPYLTVRVPTGYRMAGTWISKSGDVDRDGVRIDLYPTDVDCKSGMAAGTDETLEAPPTGTPKAFHDRVAVRNGAKGVSYTMCSDIVGGVMIAEVNTDKRRGELTMEHAKILASASTAAHASDRTAPQQPKFVFEDLGGRKFDIPAKAGGWRQFAFLGFSVEHEWPRTSHALVTLSGTDKCTYYGSHWLIPSPWKADVVAKGVRGCIDANGVKLQLAIMVDTASLSVADRERIKETVNALATAAYPGTSTYEAPSTTVATVDPTTSTTTSSSEPSTPYVPSSRSGDKFRRPLRTYLYGASLGGHMFAVAGRDDTYGVSIGYARSLAPRLRMQLESGYNSESGVLLDGRVEYGSFLGDREAGLGLWGMLGVDGLGLGREDEATADPTMVAPRIDADLYYGLRFEVVMSSISAGIGYAWRKDDAIDHAWRFDVGYRLESGHNLGFRYTGYGDAGHFLALYCRY